MSEACKQVLPYRGIDCPFAGERPCELWVPKVFDVICG